MYFLGGLFLLSCFLFLSFWSGYEKRKNNKALFVPSFFFNFPRANTYLYTDNDVARQTFEQQKKPNWGPFYFGSPLYYLLPSLPFSDEREGRGNNI